MSRRYPQRGALFTTPAGLIAAPAPQRSGETQIAAGCRPSPGACVTMAAGQSGATTIKPTKVVLCALTLTRQTWLICARCDAKA